MSMSSRLLGISKWMWMKCSLLLLVGLSTVGCQQPPECVIEGLEISDDHRKIAMLERCGRENGVLLVSAKREPPRRLLTEKLIPRNIAMSKDGSFLFVAGYRADNQESAKVDWVIVQLALDDPSGTPIVVRKGAHPIRSMIADSSNRLTYQLQVGEFQSGRPIFEWYLDDLAERPRRLGGSSYGYLLRGSSIQDKGILFLAPNLSGGGPIHQLVWLAYAADTPAPKVAFERFTNDTGTFVCNQSGDTCLEDRNTTPARNSHRFRNQVIVHRLGGQCAADPIEERVERISISPDGRVGAYISADLYDGKRGRIDPQLVLFELSGSACILTLQRIDLIRRQ